MIKSKITQKALDIIVLWISFFLRRKIKTKPSYSEGIKHLILSGIIISLIIYSIIIFFFLFGFFIKYGDISSLHLFLTIILTVIALIFLTIFTLIQNIVSWIIFAGLIFLPIKFIFNKKAKFEHHSFFVALWFATYQIIYILIVLPIFFIFAFSAFYTKLPALSLLGLAVIFVFFFYMLYLLIICVKEINKIRIWQAALSVLIWIGMFVFLYIILLLGILIYNIGTF